MCAHCHACESTKQVRCLVQACCNSETCRSPSRAVFSPRGASSQQLVDGMESCFSDIEFTSCSSQTCNNKTPLEKQTCNPGVANSPGPGPVCLKTKSSFQELKKKRPTLHPGHHSTSGKHHPTPQESLTRFGEKVYFPAMQRARTLRVPNT